MTNATFLIAKHTFKEIIKDRILYGVILFAILLISLSVALGQLSFAEQTRISIDFGLAGIHIGIVIIALFVGGSLVWKEIDKQTIFTILTRPISRLEFLIGKYLGLIAVVATLVVALSIVLFFVCLGLQWSWDINFVYALYGIVLEALILVSLSVLFGCLSKPVLSVLCTLGLFFVGHWVSEVDYFASQSESSIVQYVGKALNFMLPNLERFNWKSMVTYGDVIEIGVVGSATLYALGWVIVLFAISSFVFERKDFI